MFTEVAAEFPAITLARLLMAEEQFSKFDVDGDESLGLKELEKMLEEAGHILNQKILISVISVIDTVSVGYVCGYMCVGCMCVDACAWDVCVDVWFCGCLRGFLYLYRTAR